MEHDLEVFYQAALTAGAILSGFIGTFLNFRIQREADYFRSPGSDIGGQQHFTSSFFLIIVSAACSVVFGVVLPLFALAKGNLRYAVSPATILSGIVAALVIAGAYFFDELIHYQILFTRDGAKWRFNPDRKGWKSELWIVVGGVLSGALLAVITYCAVKSA